MSVQLTTNVTILALSRGQASYHGGGLASVQLTTNVTILALSWGQASYHGGGVERVCS